MAEMFRPLEGVKVTDLTLAGAGPSCTKMLAEFGADVIWIESVKGTSTRSVHKFDFYTTGKRSLAIDLKTKEGKEAIKRIIADSDVFVSNFRPQALEHLGLTYDEVKAVRPGIVYATITGYGGSGPEKNEPGYDPAAFWARGGMLIDIAEKGSLVVPPVAVGDISAGMCLFGGICAALYGHAVSGKGSHVYTSLLSQAVYLNHDALIETQYGEKYPKTRKAPRRAFLNTYKCKDGKWITMAITNEFDKAFVPLMKTLGLDDIANDHYYKTIDDTMYENAPKLVEAMDGAFAKITQDEAIKKLRAIDISVSKVQKTEDLLTDPQVLANKYIYSLEATVPPEDGEKEILVPASPLKFNDDGCGVCNKKRGPALGEQSEEILKQYGFSDDEIKTMLEKGIVLEDKTKHVQEGNI